MLLVNDNKVLTNYRLTLPDLIIYHPQYFYKPFLDIYGWARRNGGRMGLPGIRFWHLDERGTIWDTLIAAGTLVLGLGATLTGTVAVSHFAHQTIPAEAQLADLTNLVDGTTRDAHSSIALFTPPRDVGNNDNSDGHEVDFYTRGAKGIGHFWAYCFRGTTAACASAQPTGTVARYHYAWANLVQNGGSGAFYDSAAIPNVTKFAVQNVPASQLLDPTTNPYSASYLASTGITHITDVAEPTGYPGVTAGNNVAILTASNASGTRTVHLLARQLVPSRNIPVASYTPSPNPMTISASSITFRNPIDLPQTVGLSELNYGTRSTTPSQVYAITSDTCTGASTEVPDPTIAPTGDGTGNAAVTITPVKQLTSGESCSVTFTDNAPQSDVLSVSVGATYAPSLSGQRYLRLSGAPNIPVSFTFTESNYDLSADGGGVTSVTATGSCASSSPSVSSESLSNGDYSATITATATHAGPCGVTATDTYGQTATASTTVYGTLAVSPNPISFANPSATPINSTITDPGFGGTLTKTLDSCTNGVVASAAPGANQHLDTWTPQGPAGQCTWHVSDGSSEVDVPVIVSAPSRGPLIVTPTNIAMVPCLSAGIPGAPGDCVDAGNPSAQFYVSELNYTGTFTIASTQDQGSSCSQDATREGVHSTPQETFVSMLAGSATATSDTPVTFTALAGPYSYLYTPCTLFVNDDGTNAPVPVNVTFQNSTPAPNGYTPPNACPPGETGAYPLCYTQAIPSTPTPTCPPPGGTWPDCSTGQMQPPQLIGSAVGNVSETISSVYSGPDNSIEHTNATGSIGYTENGAASTIGCYEGVGSSGCLMTGMYVNAASTNPVYLTGWVQSEGDNGPACVAQSADSSGTVSNLRGIAGWNGMTVLTGFVSTAWYSATGAAPPYVGTVNGDGSWTPPVAGTYWLLFYAQPIGDYSGGAPVCSETDAYSISAYQ